jgi:hypothetical protein
VSPPRLDAGDGVLQPAAPRALAPALALAREPGERLNTPFQREFKSVLDTGDALLSPGTAQASVAANPVFHDSPTAAAATAAASSTQAWPAQQRTRAAAGTPQSDTGSPPPWLRGLRLQAATAQQQQQQQARTRPLLPAEGTATRRHLNSTRVIEPSLDLNVSSVPGSPERALRQLLDSGGHAASAAQRRRHASQTAAGTAEGDGGGGGGGGVLLTAAAAANAAAAAATRRSVEFLDATQDGVPTAAESILREMAHTLQRTVGLSILTTGRLAAPSHSVGRMALTLAVANS